MMQPVFGPACPKCGCTQSEVIESFTRWRKRHQRHECTNCLHTFSAPAESIDGEDETPAEYPVLFCRECKIGKMKVASTQAGVRPMKCDNCGRTCKSVERRLEL